MDKIKLSCIKQYDKGVILYIKLIPNSSRDYVVGYTDEYLKIKITSPPNENKANTHLIKYMAELFNIPKSYVSIVSGEKSKLKKVMLSGEILERIDKIIFLYDKIES